MPRGRRKKPENFEEEIAIFNAQIEDLTVKLKNLKDKRAARIKLEEKNKDADKWERIRNSGFTADDILSMVNKKGD